MGLKKNIYAGNVNVSPSTPFKSLVGLALGLIILISTAMATIVLLSSVLAPYIPASWEQKMGEESRAYFLEASIKGKDADRVNRVFATITPYLSEDDQRLDYLPVVVMDDIFNAFALPGGTIAIMTGLLDEIETDEELAFVLAHELGHFHGRDHLRGMGMQLGVRLMSMLLIGESSGSDFLADTTTTLMGLHYSRKQEKAADLYALDLLQTANLPTDGAISFMEKTRGMDDRTTFESFFTTHPHTEDRLNYVREALGTQ